MVDSTRYDDWLDKAARDIRAAKILKEHDCGNELSAFHSQQSIEKSLKAYVIAKSGVIISSHSLIFLCKEASKYLPDFSSYLKDCAFVNQFYIETRYPANDPMVVTDEEGDECIDIAIKILDRVTQELIIPDE